MYHLITGNGKGKTTAAIGMAVRAAGANMNVLFAQFVKGLPYSEHSTLEQIKKIQVEILGRECFIKREPEQADIDTAQQGWEKIVSLTQEIQFQLVILDELHIAMYYKLLDEKKVLSWLNENKNLFEIVTTGRYAPQAFCNLADLISEVKEVKHYFQNGVEARKGIEF